MGFLIIGKRLFTKRGTKGKGDDHGQVPWTTPLWWGGQKSSVNALGIALPPNEVLLLQQLPWQLGRAVQRVWERKCTDALRSGMCVLQEAALASKRWECLWNSVYRLGPQRSVVLPISAEFWSRGPWGTSDPQSRRKLPATARLVLGAKGALTCCALTCGRGSSIVRLTDKAGFPSFVK